MKNNLSILFSSHSGAYDIWHITEYYFNKYWSNCPFDVFLGANGKDKKEYCPKSWGYINYGKDISWSKSLNEYIRAINSKYVLLYVDDLILLEDVDNNMLNEILGFIKKNDIKLFRLYPNPAPNIKVNTKFGKIDVLNEVPYITSWNNVIWEKEFLLKLLEYDFNPWEFETKAGKTAESKNYYDKLYSVYTPIIKSTMFVEKGKFYPFIKEWAEKESVEFDFSKREFLSEDELKKFKKATFKGKLFNMFPNKYTNKIRKILNKEEL